MSETTQAEFDRGGAIRQEFAKRRRNQIVVAVVLVGVVVSGALLLERGGGAVPEDVGGPVFLGLVLAALGYSLVNWRCPACRGYLGRALNPKFCARCGTALS